MSAARDPATSSFKMNHTMLRIKDPKPSLDFYQRILGMKLISEHNGGDFTLYFLAFDHSNGKMTKEELEASRFDREGIVELTWNHGTEKDENFKGYHNGNDEPQGFGHICITCSDIKSTCERFESLGVDFKKKPHEGRMKTIAFIYDPDRYWIEVVENKYQIE
ncbi:Glyoxalase [Phaffia rhodozyma]|uniref:Lactoylglutathione lyase n=1 Tax=Phaffia rhodozyma TaxID=264483 RepID=A0A0F7SH76_PHARH|nr:Glyoxalase [Phaffia rhodozyma]